MILNNFIIGKSREFHISNMEATRGHHIKLEDTSKYPHRIFLKIYDYTKGGRVLFCIISTYMIFAAILLPCIKCFRSNIEKKKHFHEVRIFI